MSAQAIDPTTQDALREEIARARALLSIQREVWESLCEAVPASVLEPQLKRQEEALEAARRASIRRAEAISAAGGFDSWLASLPATAAPPLRALRKEARVLREEIQALATQCAWLARRSAYWLEAQRALVSDLAAEQLGAGTYGGGGRKSRDGQVTASILDRSA